MAKRQSKTPEREQLKELAKQRPSLSASSKASVFISHDSRDADIAEAFANLLSDVSAGMLKSFRSSDKVGSSGIAYDVEWYAAIMSKLDDATDVVALLTENSVERPWILYEAGVAKGKLNTNVLGIALGIPLEQATTTGPFGQFQNADGDEGSLTGLVMQLVKRNLDADPREEAIRTQVRAFLAKLKELLAKRGSGKKALPAVSEEQTAAKLFEEVKAMVRDLPDRVDDRVRMASKRGPFRGKRRFHPGMIEEFMFHPEMEKGDQAAASLLVFLSIIRDDLPWIYEAGIEFYRATQSGNTTLAEKAHKQFRLIAETTSHGPFFHEIIRPDDGDAFFLMRHMPEMIERLISKVQIPHAGSAKASRSKIEHGVPDNDGPKGKQAK
ncbi:MAG TPA: toll/interleukin-1 receptor domain-containing protein [Rhizomicrobium sp.]